MTKGIYDASTELAEAVKMTFATTQTTYIGTGISLQMTPFYTPNKPQHHWHAKLIIWGFTMGAALDSIVFRVVVGDDASFTNKASAIITPDVKALVAKKLEYLIDFAGAQVLMGTNAIKYVRVEADLTKASGAGGAFGFSAYLTKA